MGKSEKSGRHVSGRRPSSQHEYRVGRASPRFSPTRGVGRANHAPGGTSVACRALFSSQPGIQGRCGLRRPTRGCATLSHPTVSNAGLDGCETGQYAHHAQARVVASGRAKSQKFAAQPADILSADDSVLGAHIVRVSDDECRPGGFYTNSQHETARDSIPGALIQAGRRIT